MTTNLSLGVSLFRFQSRYLYLNSLHICFQNIAWVVVQTWLFRLDPQLLMFTMLYRCLGKLSVILSVLCALSLRHHLFLIIFAMVPGVDQLQKKTPGLG